MVYSSKWPWKPEHISVPSYVFGPPGTSTVSSQTPSRPLYHDAECPETRFLTRETYKLCSQQFALGLIKAGLQPGDRVMIMSGNDIYIPVAIMGTIMAQGIYTSANPAYRPRELAHQIMDSMPTFVLVAPEGYEVAKEAARMSGIGEERLFLFDTDIPPETMGIAQPRSPCHWESLLESPQKASDFRWKELNTPEESATTILLVYSSGTTGLPKGVEISHFQVVTNMKQTQVYFFSNNGPQNPRSLAVLPCYHGLGLLVYGFLYPKNNVEVFIAKKYEQTRFLEHIHKYRPTELVLVPAIVTAMAKNSATRSGTYDLSSVRKVLAGAAPLGMEVTKQFEAIWGGRVKVRQAWGMTECPVMSLAWDGNDTTSDSSTSVGELLPGLQAKIISDKGVEQTEPGQRGELLVRGPNVMQRYWRNPKATAGTFSNGWLKTGDAAIVDKYGKFYIVDRKKDIMKVKGLQVAPAELEGLLLEHPSVVEVAVVGVPTSEDDCLPRAYVVPRKKGTDVTERELQEFVNCNLVKHKRLTGGVVFLKELPKTSVGKIQRKILQAMADKDRGMVAARL